MHHEMTNGTGIAADPRELIHQLRRKGVTLWMEGAGLRYRAPKGVLTAEDKRAITYANEEIASLLRHHPPASPRERAVSRGGGVRRAPLSFTQLEHWYARVQYGSRPIRHIAAAFRLQGPLRVDLMKESVAAVGRRHDALRTRIVTCNGMLPIQEVADKYLSSLEVIPLQAVPEAARLIEVERQIHAAILDAYDYATSPLFRAVLLGIDASEHVLILALDHIISDLASLHLLSEEILTAYGQLLSGRPIALPRVAIQSADYAIKLLEQFPRGVETVRRRFASTSRTRFPDSSGLPADDRAGLGVLDFKIGRNVMDELRIWARHHRTTAVIATLTAYTALVLRWCQVTETVILFVTDGRTSAELERTIGDLAFPVYVRVALDERSTFLDLLKLVTEEYCRARDEADYGCVGARDTLAEYTLNTGVNWLPAAGASSGRVDAATDTPLSWTPIEFLNPVFRSVGECDEEPRVCFLEREGAIAGQVGYARKRFSEADIARFAASITEFLVAMLKEPTRRVVDVELK